MIPILWRANWRGLKQHPWQVALTLLGIALGVAIVIAIDLANTSAYRSFNLAAKTLAGRTTHEIISGPNGLPEAFYTQLRLDYPLYPSAPIIEGQVYLPHDKGKQLRLLGIDPFAESPFRDYFSNIDTESTINIAALLTQPNTVIIEYRTAQQLGLKLNDQIAVYIGSHITQLTIIGIFQGNELAQHGLANLLIADIATAQEVLDQVGRISRIDLILPTGKAGTALQNQLQKELPPEATLIPAGTRSQAITEMTHAFQLNLTALSLLALLVGSFIVFNTVAFLWLQRRRLMGLLRVLGVTQKQIFLLLVTEAVALGVLGSIGGVFLGIMLGQGFIGLVSQTFNDLYFSAQIQALFISPGSLVKGILLGLGATLVATIVPALELTYVSPSVNLRRSPLETQARYWLKWATFIGGSLLITGFLILLIANKSIILGFVGLTGLQIGGALLAPVLGTFFLILIQPSLRYCFGILGQLAVRGIIASLSRTGIAMAALTLAIAATVGIGIMINSFRLSVSQWLSMTLQADLYVSVPGAHTGPAHSSLDLSLIETITSMPEVAAISTTHWIRLEDKKGFIDMVIFQPALQSLASFRFIAGDPKQVWQAFIHDEAVLISEPYAYHHHLSPGSNLTLRTDHGDHTFTVAGVYQSYGSDRGVVTIHRHTYAHYWLDTKISGIGIYARSDADIELIRQTLWQKIQPDHPIQINTNRAIRELSLQIFDRTFAITEVVRTLAGLVAFIGIFSALMALQLERSQEFGILRAIGLTPRQLWYLMVGQTGLMGLVCGLLSLPLGLASAAGLIYVINYRSFGWSMALSISSLDLLQGIALALIAAILAGLYPAWGMAQTAPATGLRSE